MAMAECVEEVQVLGKDIQGFTQNNAVYVEVEDGSYEVLENVRIDSKASYKIQLLDKNIEYFKSAKSAKSAGDYNERYLEYYTPDHLNRYLKSRRDGLEKIGMEIKVIGKSLKGRDLYAIIPKNLLAKKTILMFGRHHGDEGTANWIIEGFLDEYIKRLDFHNDFQLILYPMINPDGAASRLRYNSRGRDLNRSWKASPEGSYDEIKTIFSDAKKYIDILGDKIILAADMHGSIGEDFIFRVTRSFVSPIFYGLQQSFIDELSKLDFWQKGSFKLSNGDPNMARIRLINHYNLNAITHETVKNIPRKSSRRLVDLNAQGVSLLHAIDLQY